MKRAPARRYPKIMYIDDNAFIIAVQCTTDPECVFLVAGVCVVSYEGESIIFIYSLSYVLYDHTREGRYFYMLSLFIWLNKEELKPLMLIENMHTPSLSILTNLIVITPLNVIQLIAAFGS